MASNHLQLRRCFQHDPAFAGFVFIYKVRDRHPDTAKAEEGTLCGAV
jgi:hypothetical protein